MSGQQHAILDVTNATVAASRIEGALLGAAIGDALGWPQERPKARADRPTFDTRNPTPIAFQQWERRAGGRFWGHVERIGAGEYSDDTQLLLATARSLLHTHDWVGHLQRWELPVWLTYERGGGRSTRKAAQQWRKRMAPWSASTAGNRDVRDYFMAGGNGVAMRVLPHALLRSQSTDQLSREIFSNGIATHGHPRAILGAQLYGLAAWLLARLSRPLKFGELIDSLLGMEPIWSAQPDPAELPPGWLEAADRSVVGGYQAAWQEVVTELRAGLELCQQAMGLGALSVDRDILDRLGCFDTQISGAGSVGALAAIYLTSRHAAEPIAGMREAAFAHGADTDTLASLVGGLLGSLHGREWIPGEWDHVQDGQYILKLANSLSAAAPSDSAVEDTTADAWSDRSAEQVPLALDAGDRAVALGPLGLCHVDGREECEPSLPSIRADSWRLRSEIGQTIFIKRLTRRQQERSAIAATSPAGEDDRPRRPGRAGPAYDIFTEHANLFALTLQPRPAQLYQVRLEERGKIREQVLFDPVEGAVAIEPRMRDLNRALRGSIIVALKKAGYRVRDRFTLVVDTATNYAPRQTPIEIFPAFTIDVIDFGGRHYLCLDHRLVVRARLSLASLIRRSRGLQLEPAQRAAYRDRDGWTEGHLLESGPVDSIIRSVTEQEIRIANEDIVPALTREQIAQLAPALGMPVQQLEESIKRLSFLTGANAPRARLDTCVGFVEQLSGTAFPTNVGKTTIHLDPTPVTLRPPLFALGKDLVEAEVAFDHVDRTKRTRDILQGLTSFGAYEKPTHPLRLVVLSTEHRAEMMDRLVERLNRGAKRYPGALKTFGSEIVVQQRILARDQAEYEARLREFVRSDQRSETDVALVYMPKAGNTEDPRHPYFRAKGLLTREGLASQMVDEATVRNPDWRDLNLTLNIYAKAGYAPWVLDEAIDGVDLFIGLSSSQVRRDGRSVRMMGYVNVFDAYGRWQFYQGDSMAFAFEDRLRHYGDLVRSSIAAHRAKNGGDLGCVHIHLTKPFSAAERSVLARAVRDEAPGAAVVFVWINRDHHLRLYDLREGGEGLISRATYLQDAPGRLYLATTGDNVFNQRGMGTPIPLKLTIWTDPPDLPLSLREIGQQVLSMTRLNWGSSRNFCQEPITTKFAGEIARLMNAFMHDPSFSVNPSLRGVPWFL